MNTLERFNDKYTLGTLDFNDMVWYLNYLFENYDPSRFHSLGGLNPVEPCDYLYFSERKNGEIEQMTCHIETVDKVIRFKFNRYNYVGEEKPYHSDDFNPIRIRKNSKGYKNFMKWWNNFVEKQNGVWQNAKYDSHSNQYGSYNDWYSS